MVFENSRLFYFIVGGLMVYKFRSIILSYFLIVLCFSVLLLFPLPEGEASGQAA